MEFLLLAPRGGLRVHLKIAPANLVRVVLSWLGFDLEDPLEERPVGPDPQVALTQHDETCYVLHRVRGQVVQLHAIHTEEGDEERVERE